MSRSVSVGLALSGGGFRATAFGLGCLRALHDTNVLSKVTVMSGVSGGSLLGALWAYGPVNFDEFDRQTVALLSRGLQLELVNRAAAPQSLARSAASNAAALLPSGFRGSRTFNRTDVLRATLAARAFGDRALGDVTHAGLATVINATDLITGNAVRFGSSVSACSPYGRIQDRIAVAEAVAASAAFPVLLPAMERAYTFAPRDHASTFRRKVALTDGGVYDNLGLSVLEPGRDRRYTDHVYSVDYIIACDAGRGRLKSSAARLLPSRLKRSFDITYRKTQDGSRARLNRWTSAGTPRAFVHAYLGMRDERLPVPVPDLVPATAVRDYPTNFKHMTERDLEALSVRGEQLTRTLLGYYCPEL